MGNYGKQFFFFSMQDNYHIWSLCAIEIKQYKWNASYTVNSFTFKNVLEVIPANWCNTTWSPIVETLSHFSSFFFYMYLTGSFQFSIPCIILKWKKNKIKTWTHFVEIWNKQDKSIDAFSLIFLSLFRC